MCTQYIVHSLIVWCVSINSNWSAKTSSFRLKHSRPLFFDLIETILGIMKSKIDFWIDIGIIQIERHTPKQCALDNWAILFLVYPFLLYLFANPFEPLFLSMLNRLSSSFFEFLVIFQFQLSSCSTFFYFYNFTISCANWLPTNRKIISFHGFFMSEINFFYIWHWIVS